MGLSYPLAAALTMLALLPSSASAHVAPINDPWIDAALAAGASEWEAAGYGEPPCRPRAYEIDDPRVPIVAVTPPGVRPCMVFYNPTWRHKTTAAIEGGDPIARRIALHDLCLTAVHEYGHLYGFDDWDPVPFSGVMTAAVWKMWLPECTKWVNRYSPPKSLRPAKGVRIPLLNQRNRYPKVWPRHIVKRSRR